jgi:hypothetical protein
MQTAAVETAKKSGVTKEYMARVPDWFEISWSNPISGYNKTFHYDLWKDTAPMISVTPRRN